MRAGISSVYKSQVTKKNRLVKGARSPRLSDSYKNYDKECGECVVVKKYDLTNPSRLETWKRLYRKHREPVKRNEHPSMGKVFGYKSNGKPILFREAGLLLKY